MTVFVRVRDKTTGHEYDVPEKALDSNHQVLPQFPRASEPRPAKHRTNLAGRPVAQQPLTPAEADEEKE